MGAGVQQELHTLISSHGDRTKSEMLQNSISFSATSGMFQRAFIFVCFRGAWNVLLVVSVHISWLKQLNDVLDNRILSLTLPQSSKMRGHSTKKRTLKPYRLFIVIVGLTAEVDVICQEKLWATDLNETFQIWSLIVYLFFSGCLIWSPALRFADVLNAGSN